MTRRRHIHLDAVGGMAGDMFVAALLDAFPDLEGRVLADVAAVLPPECGRAVLVEGTSGGMRTLRFRLADVRDDRRGPEDPAGHGDHASSHPDGHAAPATQLATDVASARRHDVRTMPRDGSYRGLSECIRSATLHEGTASAALAILTNLARAEAHIHGVPLDDVHFHELADWDSLMDVVAAGSIAAALPDARWTVSDLPVGGGTVSSAHGQLPVPAPATAELLRGFRWRDDGISGERVTPTGAAILSYLVARGARDAPEHGRLASIGIGGGTRELAGTPNVVRCLVFERDRADIGERVAVISFDVDDMTGEEIGVAAERLRTEPGVLDVSLGTRLGKKSRPMTSFRLLVDPARVQTVQGRCLSETTTIGLRWRTEERRTLARHTTTATTGEGSPVRVKHALRPTGATTHKAESDDLQDIAGLQERRARKIQAEKDPR